jgi:hypothetical protein
MTNYYNKFYRRINLMIICLYNKIYKKKYKKPYKIRIQKWGTDGLPESQPIQIQSRL